MERKLTLKIQEAQERLDLAKQNLQAAENLLENGFLRVATDIGYNAAELCARALILLKQDEIPTRHGGIVQKFSELYIKDGFLDKDLGRKINKGLDYRGDARYKPKAVISEFHAQHNLTLAQSLIEFLEKELKEVVS